MLTFICFIAKLRPLSPHHNRVSSKIVKMFFHFFTNNKNIHTAFFVVLFYLPKFRDDWQTEWNCCREHEDGVEYWQHYQYFPKHKDRYYQGSNLSIQPETLIKASVRNPWRDPLQQTQWRGSSNFIFLQTIKPRAAAPLSSTCPATTMDHQLIAVIGIWQQRTILQFHQL